MERKKERKAPNKMGSPPYYDAQPARMSRTVGKSKGGDKFSVPSKAKYGLGEGQAPTRMDRSVPRGKSGNTFSIPNAGAGTSSRSDKGATKHSGKHYGVGGVSVKDGDGRYGV